MDIIPDVKAVAPIRICDLGGWTDTWVARYGAVLNIAVRPAAEVCVRVFPRGSRASRIIIDAVDYNVRYAPDLDAAAWGPQPLLEAALRMIHPPAAVDVEISVRSEAPAGSSTGTSAAVLVALLGALDRLAGGRRSAAEIARAAHTVETDLLGLQSGVQDQLCAAHGGINFIEIVEYPVAYVHPLTLDGPTLAALGRRLMLVYLGRPHASSAVHQRVIADLLRRGPDCRRLDDLRQAARQGRDALLRGDLAAFGEAMRENTDAQARLHTDLVHADARRLIDLARAHGAVGWKVNGAGGDGGSVTILTDGDDVAHTALRRALRGSHPQASVIPIQLSPAGLSVQ